MQCLVRELSPEEYAQWDRLVAVSPQRSLFMQRWWMDIVTQGQFRLIGCFENERLMAGLPIWPCSTLGVARLRQPPLTPYWGPILLPLEGKYQTRLSAETDILRAFAGYLDAWPDLYLTMHPTIQNALPLYWQKMTLSVRYTFRIERLSENLPVGKGIHRSLRNALNRAASNGLSIQENVDPMIVAEMSRMSMERQDVESSAEIRAFWPRLSQEAHDRNCILNAAAVDGKGNIHAAFAILWDDRYAYDLYGGGDPRFRESGGGTLVLQHLLETASNVAPSFDFEGSMLEHVGRYFRQFGGELTPYLAATRSNSFRLNTARAVQQWLQSRKTRKAKTPIANEEKASIPTAA